MLARRGVLALLLLLLRAAGATLAAEAPEVVAQVVAGRGQGLWDALGVPAGDDAALQVCVGAAAERLPPLDALAAGLGCYANRVEPASALVALKASLPVFEAAHPDAVPNLLVSLAVLLGEGSETADDDFLCLSLIARAIRLNPRIEHTSVASRTLALVEIRANVSTGPERFVAYLQRTKDARTENVRLVTSLLLERGDVHGASRVLEASYLNRRGVNVSYPEDHEPFTSALDHWHHANVVSLRHDAAQLRDVALTHRESPLRSWFEDVVAPALELTAEELAQERGEDEASLSAMALTQPQRQRLDGVYKRALWSPPLPAMPEGEGPLNPFLDWKALEEAFFADGQLLVIDNLLTPKALFLLQQHMAQSTSFHEIKAGYVGSYMHDGLHAELLLQLATQLKQRLPRVLGKHRLLEMWAYKYNNARRRTGVGLHGDDFAVNLNMWLAPSEANLDPTSGGMVLYPLAAPSDWDFVRFNLLGHNSKLEQYLLQNVEAVTVPHATNRLVIFNSRLFHRTDRLHFKDGLRNHRINLTMLFGFRQDAAEMEELSGEALELYGTADGWDRYAEL